jgi:hypothetical protein
LVSASGKSSNVRLPRHVRPEKYRLYLTPFIEVDNFTIQGHVDIEVPMLQNIKRQYNV